MQTETGVVQTNNTNCGLGLGGEDTDKQILDLLKARATLEVVYELGSAKKQTTLLKLLAMLLLGSVISVPPKWTSGIIIAIINDFII